MVFTYQWFEFEHEGKELAYPTLYVGLVRQAPLTGLVPLVLPICSSYPYSVAPSSMCDELGRNWEDGDEMCLGQYTGRLQNVEVHISVERQQFRLRIPFLFVKEDDLGGEIPQFLGTEGLFDEFRVEFNKIENSTLFEQYIDR